MIQVEVEIIDKITETFYRILRGEKSSTVVLPEDYPDNEMKQMIGYFNKFISEYEEYSKFMYAVSQGQLEHNPPVGKMAINHYAKSIQSSLKHFTYKAKRMASGDLTQKMEFIGDFSEEFNNMARRLDEAFKTIETQRNELGVTNEKLKQTTEELEKERASLEEKVKERTAELENLFKSFIKTISSVIDARDPVTRGHSERVAQYSLNVGRALNLSNEKLKLLEYAAILHDVGKISIPDAILLKSGRFTLEEYEIMKYHPIYTKQILNNIYYSTELKDIPLIAAGHHERLDGSGYPLGLKEEDLSLSARIIAVVDIYDALVSYDRPYKSALSSEKAIEILLNQANEDKLDKNIVKLFVEKKLYEFERREYVRISADFSFEYKVLSPEEFKSYIPVMTHTKNISAAGLLFESTNFLPFDSHLQIKLNIPNFVVDVLARVVRCVKPDDKYQDKYQIGILFLNLGSDTKKLVSQYIVEEI